MKKNWKTHWSAISRVFYELEHIVDRVLEDSGTEYGYVRRRNYEKNFLNIIYDLVDNVPRYPGSAHRSGAFLFQGGGQAEYHRQA